MLFAGFPCQPFSSQGDNLGELDPRGTLVWEVLKYIKRTGPEAVVLENVGGLLHRHPATLHKILTELLNVRDLSDPSKKHFGYVSYKLMNSLTHGAVPQNRERVYIVALKRGSMQMEWPEPIPQVRLESILEPTITKQPLSIKNVELPSAPTSQRKVLNILKELEVLEKCQ